MTVCRRCDVWRKLDCGIPPHLAPLPAREAKVDLSKIQGERFVVRVECLSNEGPVGQTSGRCEVSVIATETSRAKTFSRWVAIDSWMLAIQWNVTCRCDWVSSRIESTSA